MEGMEGMEAVAHNPPALKTRRGFNLIEAAIVLGVVGAVIGGIWVAATTISYNYHKQQFLQGLLSLQTNAARYLTQKMPPGNGYYISNTAVYPKAFYDLIYPKEWTRFNMFGKILSKGSWTAIEIVSDADGTRFLQIVPRFNTRSLCDEVAAYATAHRIRIYENKCFIAQRILFLWLEIPRRD